nr:DUF4393 domain-containing protein [Rhizobium cauense]
MALAPIQVTAALQDRFRDFLDRTIRRVPEDRRVSPPPQIAGPVFEGLKYEEAGTPLDEMFSQLLSKGMDSQYIHLAHPSYPQIIRQLSRDEAVLLLEISSFEKSGAPAKRRTSMDLNTPPPPAWKNVKIELDELNLEQLHYPDNFDLYFQHLYSMGIAAAFKVHEEPTKNLDGTQKGTRVLEEFRLTDFGRHFMSAVTK